MFQLLQNWHVRPRALGILVAKVLLSFATPLAGQPGEIKPMPIVPTTCIVPAAPLPQTEHLAKMQRPSPARNFLLENK
jgi:hypothetical protein